MDWSEAILRCVSELGGTASDQEIYRRIGDFKRLTRSHLAVTVYGGRPAYFHTVRSYLSLLVRKGDLIWLERGLHKISSSASERIAKAPARDGSIAGKPEMRVRPRTEAEDEADAEAASFDAQERNAGFQSNTAIRLAVEKWAMDKAKMKLSVLGFSNFEDTSKRECYDYTCEQDGHLYYVEVKGTQGNGASVILTGNEIKHGKAHHPYSIAVIVHSVVVDSDGRASGGVPCVYLPWILESAVLTPIQYKWTIS